MENVQKSFKKIYEFLGKNVSAFVHENGEKDKYEPAGNGEKNAYQ